jgi:hypothetical protein
MNISIQQLEKAVVGILMVGVVGFSLYLGYIVFFTGPKPSEFSDVTSVNKGMFSGNKKLESAAGAVNDPSFKSISKTFQFTQSALYKSFTESPESVPLSEKRGRANPFVPSYVTP